MVFIPIIDLRRKRRKSSPSITYNNAFAPAGTAYQGPVSNRQRRQDLRHAKRLAKHPAVINNAFAPPAEYPEPMPTPAMRAVRPGSR